MISISQKCLYALRSILELAKRRTNKPIPIESIADAQQIPQRFLEIILNELRREGYVESHRGPRGGYVLTRSPDELTVGEIYRLVEGPIRPVKCVAGDEVCQFRGNCPWMDMWVEAAKAMQDVLDKTTIQAILDKEKRSKLQVHIATV
jgi:Rrf2 family protein